MEDIQQAKLQYKCVVYNQEPIKKREGTFVSKRNNTITDNRDHEFISHVTSQ